jgi:type II secretory pathway pseudopilin PulG
VRASGFALVEAILALVLLGVGVATVMTAATASARVLRVASMEQAAIVAAESALDSLASALDASNGAGQNGMAMTAGLRVAWSVTPEAAGEDGRALRRIRVAVHAHDDAPVLASLELLAGPWP